MFTLLLQYAMPCHAAATLPRAYLRRRAPVACALSSEYRYSMLRHRASAILPLPFFFERHDGAMLPALLCLYAHFVAFAFTRYMPPDTATRQRYAVADTLLPRRRHFSMLYA